MILIQTLLVAGLALVHLFAGRLRFLQVIPRSRWLSMAGGVSVAYVFVHIFPELEETQKILREAAGGSLAFLEHHAYLVALSGLAVFYGLERLVKSQQRRSNHRPGGSEDEPTPGMGVFYLHISSFAVYNALIGYLLLHREEQDLRGLLLFSLAMALHFLVNDFGLQEDHRDTYRRMGRWVLAGAIAIGWCLGIVTEVSRPVIGVLFAFLAGGIVLNVLKEELPEERQSRFLPFALGAASFTVLLLVGECKLFALVGNVTYAPAKERPMLKGAPLLALLGFLSLCAAWLRAPSADPVGKLSRFLPESR